jgi:hypothetical protein
LTKVADAAKPLYGSLDEQQKLVFGLLSRDNAHATSRQTGGGNNNGPTRDGAHVSLPVRSPKTADAQRGA